MYSPVPPTIIGFLPRPWMSLMARAASSRKSEAEKSASGSTDVEQMMGYTAALIRGRFCGADFHAAIYLHRIGIDDLSVEPLGKANGQFGLPGTGRPDDDDDARLGGTLVHSPRDRCACGINLSGTSFPFRPGRYAENRPAVGAVGGKPAASMAATAPPSLRSEGMAAPDDAVAGDPGEDFLLCIGERAASAQAGKLLHDVTQDPEHIFPARSRGTPFISQVAPPNGSSRNRGVRAPRDARQGRRLPEGELDRFRETGAPATRCRQWQTRSSAARKQPAHGRHAGRSLSGRRWSWQRM